MHGGGGVHVILGRRACEWNSRIGHGPPRSLFLNGPIISTFVQAPSWSLGDQPMWDAST